MDDEQEADVLIEYMIQQGYLTIIGKTELGDTIIAVGQHPRPGESDWVLDVWHTLEADPNFMNPGNN